MDQNRKIWNEQQKLLRQKLSDPRAHLQSIALFLQQHASVHSADVSGGGLWSFADEVLNGVPDVQIRAIPTGGEHSIAWIVWHMARIEDITMNMILSGNHQILDQDGWFDRLGIPIRNSGNEMSDLQVGELSRGINLAVLWAYRNAVGSRTREIVKNLKPVDLTAKVDAARLKRVLDEGAVDKEAGEVIDYWSNLTHAGLLLMPPTRHNFIHLNECARIHKMVMAKNHKS